MPVAFRVGAVECGLVANYPANKRTTVWAIAFKFVRGHCADRPVHRAPPRMVRRADPTRLAVGAFQGKVSGIAGVEASGVFSWEVVVAEDASCVFCKIVAGEIPATVVAEDESALAFLDVGPLAEGHLLLIPKEHFANISEMPPELVAAIARRLPELGRAAREVMGVEGFNVLVNEGRVAGQEVPHVHFHIIPRASGDRLGYRWNAGKYADDRAEAIQSRYKKVLGD